MGDRLVAVTTATVTTHWHPERCQCAVEIDRDTRQISNKDRVKRYRVSDDEHVVERKSRYPDPMR